MSSTKKPNFISIVKKQGNLIDNNVNFNVSKINPNQKIEETKKNDIRENSVKCGMNYVNKYSQILRDKTTSIDKVTNERFKKNEVKTYVFEEKQIFGRKRISEKAENQEAKVVKIELKEEKIETKEEKIIETPVLENDYAIKSGIIKTQKNNLVGKKDTNIFKRKIEENDELKNLKSKFEQQAKILREKESKILSYEFKIRSLIKENKALKSTIITQKEKIDSMNLEFQSQFNYAMIYGGTLHENYQNQNSNNIANHNINDLIENNMVDPDQMTYEQLLELGEKIGNVEIGFKPEELSLIPISKFSKLGDSELKIEQCSICQFEFVEDEEIKSLECGHFYHCLCLDEWLTKEKKCPMCKKEVIIDV